MRLKKVFEEGATAFGNPNMKPTITATGSKEITLKLAIDEPEEALLVYEIYRDVEYLGVTYNDTFVDSTAVAGTEHSYTVKAYDRKFNVSLESDPAVKNASEPMLKVQDKIALGLYDSFDPMSYITASDVNGADISNRIEVLENTVDIMKKGSYYVKYSVSDQDGNTSAITVPVQVAAKVDFMDTLTPFSSQGYYKVNKDHNNATISLKGTQGEIAYSHGISAHANTTVTYAIGENNYDVFEAFIGLEDAVRTIQYGQMLSFIMPMKTELAKANQILMGSVSQEEIDETTSSLSQIIDAAVISQGKIELGLMLAEAFDSQYDYYSKAVMWEDYCFLRSVYQKNYESETAFTELELRIMTVLLEQMIGALTY